jgi:hypothetical protein
MKKNIQKQNYFRPTDPNFFGIWNRNHRYFFFYLSTLVKHNGTYFWDLC